jgi:deazaflavin-dependent oxidoreductase (nitroreductase family)
MPRLSDVPFVENRAMTTRAAPARLRPTQEPVTTRPAEPAPASGFGDLPYGPTLTRILDPMHGAFIGFNRWVAVPALRAGLGPLFSTPIAGSLMVLRTTGRKSGLPRDVPLGYAILDGSVYCIAGFGVRTQWYQNILAEPAVEVVLPIGAYRGRAEEVTDPDEWIRAFRLLMTNMGPIGRATTGDVRTASDDRLREMGRGLPLVRVRPTGIGSGPADPGGLMWIPLQAAGALATVWLGAKALRAVGRAARKIL